MTDSALPLPIASRVKLPRVFVVGDSTSIHYGPYFESLGAGLFHYARKEDDAGAPRAAANLDVPTGANGGDSAMVLAYLTHRSRFSSSELRVARH